MLIKQVKVFFLLQAFLLIEILSLNKNIIILFVCVCLDDTLQNCTLELATLGDLKLVERPHPVMLAPHDFCNIRANVKVSSTENGIIFGNIGKWTSPTPLSSSPLNGYLNVYVEFILVYDTSVNMNVVILNTIHIDIMDYILPATCTDTEFRQMWQDFEWENKVKWGRGKGRKEGSSSPLSSTIFHLCSLSLPLTLIYFWK